MDRREILKSALLAGSLPLLPQVLRRALAGPGPDAGELQEAVRTARARGRPLLVLVVPADEAGRYLRGQALGEWLTHGGDAALADLACVDVLAARLEGVASALDLSSIRHDAAAGTPALLLVETQGEVAAVTGIDVPLVFPHEGRLVLEDARLVEGAKARIRALEAALGRTLHPDAGAFGRRAEAAAADLAPEARERLAARIRHGARFGPEEADRHAPLLRLFVQLADTGPARREALIEDLAAAARARLVGQAPRGARWASDSGCGWVVEGSDEGRGIDCGMGHVPEISRRFLWFFTQEG